MDTNDIKQLAELMRKNQISRLEWEDGKSRLHLERSVGQSGTFLPVEGANSAIPQENEGESASDGLALQDIVAPMVGVFYAAKAPGEKPFVRVGDVVKAGDTLCIIEAMKLMNEITAERGGRIAEICVSDGAIVEYGQTIFRLE